jgi:branched-subunit amino acid aminotransferase/4-amino-4-deoxychorismate lyase
MVLFLNGEFVSAASAAIPIDDPAFAHGDGIYETVLVRKGRLPFWEDHWTRLCASADALEIEVPLTFAQATDVLRELVRRNDLPEAIGRVQLSGGGLPPASPPGGNGRRDRAARRPRTLLMRLDPLPAYGPEEILRGWKIVLSKLPYSPFLPHVKHTSRVSHVLARREAARANAQEAILMDRNQVLLEGTRSSLFFIRRGVLYTPALDCGILAGITREKVLRAARREGIPINEGIHQPVELTRAEEVFLSFTSAGIMPVTDVDGRPVGRGRMGPATLRLKAAYDRMLATTLARATALV